MQYIPTDLPQYWKLNNRSDFQHAVIQSNAVLLFSEDGQSLTAKTHQGTFITVGGAASLRAGVLVSDSGTLKVQPLSFDGTIPSDSGALENLSDSSLLIFETGHEEPDYGGAVVPGSSMEFYKCSYVNSNSWGGYKAVQDPVTDVYSFEATATSGLTWSANKPNIGKCYANGALVKVELPTVPHRGLIFYAPLDHEVYEAATGQVLTAYGTILYTTHDGIPCGYFNGGADLHMTGYSAEIPSGYHERTVSAWIYAQQAGWSWAIGFGNQGPSGQQNADILGITSDYNPVYSQAPDVPDTSTNAYGKWLHICGVVDNDGYRNIYVNGVFKARTEMTAGTGTAYGIYIGSSCGVEHWYGYLAAVRVYNRALTSAEIAQLAAEFAPTA